MLSGVSAGATRRFQEVRTLLSYIAAKESTPPMADSDEITMLRGLFFVHLYAAFEFSVTDAVQGLLQQISQRRIPYAHLEQLFHAVALDGGFAAIADAGPGKKWKARKNLLRLQRSQDPCQINDTAFHRDLQNVWYETLENLFECFCINPPVLPDPRFQGYIDEVVEKRNAVAHGRESPLVVGRMRTSGLRTRVDAMSGTAMHVILQFGEHLASRAFVASAHR